MASWRGAVLALVLASTLNLTGQRNLAGSKTFENPEIQRSAAGPYRFMRGGVVYDGVYEVRTATLLDLIRAAYGVSHVVGGPPWLAWDRFDVSGRLPQGSSERDVPELLQEFLSKTFELRIRPPAVHIESATKPPEASAMTIRRRLSSPREFEVATIRPSLPDTSHSVRLGDRQISWTGFPLKELIAYSFMTIQVDERLSGVPRWAHSAKFDVVAQTPADWPSPRVDIEVYRPMLARLLEDRFHLKTHIEDRPVSAYTLRASKPKLKRANPSRRTSCDAGSSGPRSVPYPVAGTISCYNITIEEFVGELELMSSHFISTPVLNATGLDGRWDLSFTFSGFQRGAVPNLSDTPPTFFEALEEQLGLLLELKKRPVPVLVVDSLDTTPTEN